MPKKLIINKDNEKEIVEKYVRHGDPLIGYTEIEIQGDVVLRAEHNDYAETFFLLSEDPVEEFKIYGDSSSTLVPPRLILFNAPGSPTVSVTNLHFITDVPSAPPISVRFGVFGQANAFKLNDNIFDVECNLEHVFHPPQKLVKPIVGTPQDIFLEITNNTFNKSFTTTSTAFKINISGNTLNDIATIWVDGKEFSKTARGNLLLENNKFLKPQLLEDNLLSITVADHSVCTINHNTFNTAEPIGTLGSLINITTTQGSPKNLDLLFTMSNNDMTFKVRQALSHITSLLELNDIIYNNSGEDFSNVHDNTFNVTVDSHIGQSVVLYAVNSLENNQSSWPQFQDNIFNLSAQCVGLAHPESLATYIKDIGHNIINTI